jgi:predicted  nucleic acid-binding Zn-ribbon protein
MSNHQFKNPNESVEEAIAALTASLYLTDTNIERIVRLESELQQYKKKNGELESQVWQKEEKALRLERTNKDLKAHLYDLERQIDEIKGQRS